MNRGGVVTEKVWFNFAPDRVHWASCAGRDFTHRQTVKRKAAGWGRRYAAMPPAELPGGAGGDHGGRGAGAARTSGAHLDRLRACFARMPDPRRGDNRRYAMADIGMAALSVTSPVPGAPARAGREAHAPTRTPCSAWTASPHVRQMLDGVPTAHFDDEFRRGSRRARRSRDAPPRRPGARRPGRHGVLPLAQHPLRPLLDPQAPRRRHGVLPPDAGRQHRGARHGPDARCRRSVSPQDGADKQDCEAGGQALAGAPRRAHRRPAPGVPRRRPYACQPVCQALDAGGDFRSPASSPATRPSTSTSTASACPRCAAPRAAARSAASTATAG